MTENTARPASGRHPSQTRRPKRIDLRRLAADDRGSVLGFTAIAFLGILGMLALAIDLGMLFEARGQAQRAADAAALAGAAALVDWGNDPAVEPTVYEYAKAYADANPVRGELASVEPSDVVVDWDDWYVTVTVHRTTERENPVATLFGRIIGINEVDVTAVASAEAAAAGAVNCLLPLALPDRWAEMSSPPNDSWDSPPDYYIPPPDPPNEMTGYKSPEDIGLDIVIKPFMDTSRMNPSWWYPWRPPGQQGAADYRENIRDCVDPDLIYGVGQQVDSEPGAMQGPTLQGFQDLIDQDPDARWDDTPPNPPVPGKGCVTRGGDCVYDSPRVRPMPLFDPREEPHPGTMPFTFTNFINVFVDQIVGNEVHVRFMGLAAIGPGDPAAGTAVRFVRLIQ